MVAIKNRRCVSVEAYLSTLFMFAKAGALILFYKMDVQLSVWYLLTCIGEWGLWRCCGGCGIVTYRCVLLVFLFSLISSPIKDLS